MTDLDPDLAAALAASCEQRIRQQIAAAQQRLVQANQSRAEFGERRDHGLRARHAAKQARQRLTERHMLPPGNSPADTTTKENPS